VQAALRELLGGADRAASVLLALVSDGAPQVGATMSALRQLFGALASAGETLLVVEDVQWADADSREFIARLCADAPRLRLRVLLTGRPRTPLPSGLATLQLRPLEAAAARALVESVAPDLTQAMVARVLERGEGNPRDLAALAEAARGGGTSLPESIEGWYAARIDALSGPAREVLERTAVLGRTAEAGLVRRMCADLPRAEAALQEVLSRRLLVSVPGGRHLSFDREMMREIAYMRMTSARRRQLHLRAGRALRGRGEAGAAVAPEVVAWHLARSDAPLEAVGPLVEAARRSLAHGRPRIALAHAEGAARIGEAHGGPLAGDAQRVLGDVWLELGRADLAVEAWRAAGDGAGQQGAALVAAGFAREALAAVEGDGGAMAAAVRARALSHLGDPRASLAHVEALRGAGTAEERARALRFYGADLASGDRPDDALEVLRAAVEAAGGDPAARADALDLLSGVHRVRGSIPAALAGHREALALREQVGDAGAVADTLRGMGVAESIDLRHAAALGHLLAARSVLRDAGLDSRVPRVEVSLAEAAIRRGDPARARSHLERASDVAGRGRVRRALAHALAEEDSLARARWAEQALQLARADRWRSAAALAEGIAAASRGDGEGVAAALRTLTDLTHLEFARWLE
jgi:tetratricopeptide (TPR) repeat protein